MPYHEAQSRILREIDQLRDNIDLTKNRLETEEDPERIELLNATLISAQADLEAHKDALAEFGVKE